MHFVAKQDPKTLVQFADAEAVRREKLQVPISQELPLRDFAQGNITVEKRGAGKILLVA